MKCNPQKYFNFGFNFNDFMAYMRKIIWMRANRKIIEEIIMTQNADLKKRWDQ